MCSGNLRFKILMCDNSFIRVSEVSKVRKDHLVRPEGQVFLEALDSRDLRETEDHR